MKITITFPERKRVKVVSTNSIVIKNIPATTNRKTLKVVV